MQVLITNDGMNGEVKRIKKKMGNHTYKLGIESAMQHQTHGAALITMVP